MSAGARVATIVRGRSHAAEVVLAASLVGLIIVEYAVIVLLPSTWNRVLAFDYWPYVDAASRWLHGGSFYLPYQLSGPYPVVEHEIMYPPSALFLLVPFTVLPAPLWWAIPTAVAGWFVASYRPSLLGWTGILACLAFPWTPMLWLAGNPVIWIVAGLAAAPRLGWPGAILALKPQFAPLALIGWRHRSFWIASVIVGAASLLLLPLWFDWLNALRNVSSWPGGNLAYWVNNLPLLAIPLIAWLARTSGRTRTPGATRPSGEARTRGETSAPGETQPDSSAGSEVAP